MKIYSVLLSYLFIVLLLLAGCRSQLSLEVPATVVESRKINQAAVKQSWEMEWENITKEARKEGKLILYSEVGAEFR